jgi:hypothetical protein
MNALVPLEPQQALSIAQAFAGAKMVPQQFKQSVGDCYIAVTMAHRYGMDPFLLMQEMYIINGRPMLSGKLTAAICNHNLAEPLTPVYSGDGADRKVTITGRVEGREPQAIELTVKQAKTSNEQWTKNPDQMLMYAGSRMWARRYTPDVILGILFDDEVEATPYRPAPRPELPPIAPAIKAHPQLRDAIDELIDPETGEVAEEPAVEPHKILFGGDWRTWGEALMAHLRGCTTIDQVDAWMMLNQDRFLQMKEEKKNLFKTLQDAVDKVKEALVAA